jgi:Gram-negative bacterial TonB protein C-terminal
MSASSRLPLPLILAAALTGPLSAQAGDVSPRRLSPTETGCDSLQRRATDSVYEAEAVDQPVRAQRLPIEEMPFRAREVLNGRAVFSFIVEPSGRVDRCSIELMEETTPEWTAAVLKELRQAKYQPARLQGRPVRQRVYQLFTYHSDGRLLHGR